MVVDDDEDIRDVLKFILETDGYHVETANDGFDAWRKLHTTDRPSLILLDLMMPRMDGEEFMKALRTSPFSDIPVVIMSGHQDAGDKSKQLNGNCCLRKPVEYDELLATVHRFVKNGSRQVIG